MSAAIDLRRIAGHGRHNNHRRGLNAYGVVDLTGSVFGLLTVVSLSEERHRSTGALQWVCRCECGNTALAIGSTLKRGHKKSCGCVYARRGWRNPHKARTAQGKYCTRCFDLPHRRPKQEPCRCGKTYEPDITCIELIAPLSNIARVMSPSVYHMSGDEVGVGRQPWRRL